MFWEKECKKQGCVLVSSIKFEKDFSSCPVLRHDGCSGPSVSDARQAQWDTYSYDAKFGNHLWLMTPASQCRDSTESKVTWYTLIYSRGHSSRSHVHVWDRCTRQRVFRERAGRYRKLIKCRHPQWWESRGKTKLGRPILQRTENKQTSPPIEAGTIKTCANRANRLDLGQTLGPRYGNARP